MANHVNYNNISPVYNERYKVSPLEGVEKKLISTVEEYKPNKILEAGCGTGHWLNLLSQKKFNTTGIDYSYGMLEQAHKNYSLKNLINSDANTLPFKSKYFDLIYCINAIHHFPDPKKFIADCSSLLNKDGILLIIGFDPRDKDNDWYLYDYFDRTSQLDLDRFPPFPDIDKWMRQNNYSNVKTELVHTVLNDKVGEAVLQDHFLDKRGASQLALLSDDEYVKGINKIKDDIHKSKAEGKEIIFKVKLKFFSISGIKS